ncbi:ABC transporter ATP-binding protein [Eoetvoesiella caeni]
MLNLALEVADLQAWHGAVQVLHGINFNAAQGEIITLLGREGSGRNSTLRALLGVAEKRSGSVRIHATESIHLSPEKISHLGISYCPEQRGIFSGLTCEENLLLPPSTEETLGGGMSLAEIYELFPSLEERRHLPGTRLSGGEQQLLAVARILRTGANILLLNEIAQGLAPIIVQSLAGILAALKEKGYTVILAEHNSQFSAPLADRYYIIEQGRIIEQFQAADLPSKQDVLHSLLGA